MANKTFAQGVIIKEIETQYGSIKKISIKVDEFKEFMDTYDKSWWINLDMQKWKAGKYYMALNEWKPDGEYKKTEKNETEQKMSEVGGISIEDIPF